MFLQTTYHLIDLFLWISLQELLIFSSEIFLYFNDIFSCSCPFPAKTHDTRLDDFRRKRWTRVLQVFRTDSDATDAPITFANFKLVSGGLPVL